MKEGERQVNDFPERKPEWLKIKLNTNQNFKEIKQALRCHHLHTVCEEAKCPNLHECFSQAKTATLMILGDICTRNCQFCGVKKGEPRPDDALEAERVAQWVKEIALEHVVVTMVSRDDLKDGGAGAMGATIEAIRRNVPGCTIEVLCSDFKGEPQYVAKVIQRRPDIFAHNVETVRRLSPLIRPKANYERSLQVLKWAKAGQINGYIKSGLMLGLGETQDDVLVTMEDLKRQGVDILVLGQYLQPGNNQVPVQKYWHPSEFEELNRQALTMGFAYCEAGPLVRSSYHSKEQLRYLHG